MSLEFGWDRKKAEANFASHGIDFEEALTVFRDPLARILRMKSTLKMSHVRSSSDIQ